MYFLYSYTVAIQCGLLVAPTNGNVDVAGTIVGSRASYSCHPGFRLIGREVRTCQESEEWSGQAPICQCKLLVFKNSLVCLCCKCSY